MQVTERNVLTVRGHVRAAWVDRATGREIVVCDKDNVILYSAADIVGRLVSGDMEVVPGFVGFVYAPAAASVPNPASDASPRHFDWDDIMANITAPGGDMIISPLDATPRLSASEAAYSTNLVTFSAMSDISAAPVNGSPAPVPGSDKYFQVALLSRVMDGGSPIYIPFAYTQLAAGDGGVIVLADMELTVYWSIKFK